MSHTIIIVSDPGGDGLEDQSATSTVGVNLGADISYRIEYRPSHDLTPEQVGARVEKILRKLGQMGGDSGHG